MVNDENMFEWEVALFGPPDTLYQGGYFKAHMKFPRDYPYSPPSVRFVTKVWHPNVYEVSKNSSLWVYGTIDLFGVILWRLIERKKTHTQ